MRPMKSPWLHAFLGALVGGALASWLTVLQTSSPSVEAEKPKKSAGQSSSKADDVADEDEDALHERLRKLEHRLSVMTRAVASRGPLGQDGEDSGSDGSILPSGASDVADPVFEAAVLDVMDREVERKEGEEEAYREGLRVERSKRFASTLGEQLALGTEEQEKMAKIITDYFNTFRDLRDSPDRPVTRREWSEKSAELQAALEARLKETLSKEQYEAYEALPEEDKIGFGRGGRSDSGSRPNQNEQGNRTQGSEGSRDEAR